MSRRTRLSLLGLCLLVGGSGALHFIVPGPYRRIVPAPLRAHAAAVVVASGLCELVCAALLAIPRTRRLGATATAVLFVAVFPANIQMALDSLHADTPVAVAAAAWLRLPLQIPLVLWALRFRHHPHLVGSRALKTAVAFSMHYAPCTMHTGIPGNQFIVHHMVGLHAL